MKPAVKVTAVRVQQANRASSKGGSVKLTSSLLPLKPLSFSPKMNMEHEIKMLKVSFSLFAL